MSTSDSEEGKEFAPDRQVPAEEEATVEEGSGKKFAAGTDAPDETRERGSGKQFSPSVGPPHGRGRGTGKEFAAGRQTDDPPEDTDLEDADDEP